MTASYPPIADRYVSLLWAEADAAEDIAKLHAELFHPAWDANTLRDMLADPTTSALIAKVRLNETAPHMPAGFVIGRTAADEAEVLTIGVSEPFQRRGIGRRLMDGLIRAVAGLGAGRIFLEVAADNDGARGLYLDMGFTAVGLRPAYYQRPDAPPADALTLACELPAKS